jgi:hypothetical protein
MKGWVMSERPSFSAPLSAALRQGAKEISQVLPAFPESVRPVEEPGTLGNLTPSMVTAQITGERGYSAMVEGYAARGQRAEPQQEMQRE